MRISCLSNKTASDPSKDMSYFSRQEKYLTDRITSLSPSSCHEGRPTACALESPAPDLKAGVLTAQLSWLSAPSSHCSSLALRQYPHSLALSHMANINHAASQHLPVAAVQLCCPERSLQTIPRGLGSLPHNPHLAETWPPWYAAPECHRAASIVPTPSGLSP